MIEQCMNCVLYLVKNVKSATSSLIVKFVLVPHQKSFQMFNVFLCNLPFINFTLSIHMCLVTNFFINLNMYS